MTMHQTRSGARKGVVLVAALALFLAGCHSPTSPDECGGCSSTSIPTLNAAAVTAAREAGRQVVIAAIARGIKFPAAPQCLTWGYPPIRYAACDFRFKGNCVAGLTTDTGIQVSVQGGEESVLDLIRWETGNWYAGQCGRIDLMDHDPATWR